MKLVLSPTKTMNMAGQGEKVSDPQKTGRPEFEQEAGLLIRELAALDMPRLKKLFKTSDVLTQKVHEMVKGFAGATPGPAMFAFRGEAFKTLEPEDFTKKQIRFAQENLRVFSGLYGVLSPLDSIKPYRLDFNTPLKINAKSLKAFWKDRLIPYFESLLEPGESLINLASNEYASVLSSKELKEKTITLQFREQAGEKLKNITVRAKQARGSFARHIIRRALTDPKDLKQAEIDGYAYSQDLSSDREWFFIRRRTVD